MGPLRNVENYTFTVTARCEMQKKAEIGPGRPENHKKSVFSVFQQEQKIFLTQNHYLECSPT